MRHWVRAGWGLWLLLACMTAGAQPAHTPAEKSAISGGSQKERFASTRLMRQAFELDGTLPSDDFADPRMYSKEMWEPASKLLALNERIEAIRHDIGPRDPSLPPLLIEMAEAAAALFYMSISEDNYAEAVSIAGWEAVAAMPQVPGLLRKWCSWRWQISTQPPIRDDAAERARACGEELIKVGRFTRGPEHLDTALDELLVGRLYGRVGLAAESTALLDHAIPIVVRTLPPGDPTRSFALVERGKLESARGMTTAAVSTYREAIAQWSPSTHHDRRELAYAHAALGVAERAAGNESAAEAAFRRCRDTLAIYARNDINQQANCWLGVALSLQWQGRVDDAARSYDELLAWTLGRDWADVRVCTNILNAYGVFLRETGQEARVAAVEARITTIAADEEARIAAMRPAGPRAGITSPTPRPPRGCL